MDVNRILGAVSIVLVTLALAGCESRVSISAEERDIALCNDGATLLLAEISTSRPLCDAAGAEMVYPDGFVATVPQIGNQSTWGSSSSEVEHYAVNEGIYGIAAGTLSADGIYTWSGHADAIEDRNTVLGDTFPESVID